MVLIGAAVGVAWEVGVLDGLSGVLFERAGVDAGRGFFAICFGAIFDGGRFRSDGIGDRPGRVRCVPAAVVRLISMIWAFVRLYDFRLTRVGEDLRSEYGLFTKVAATVPIRRVQTITFSAGPLHRWLERATVRVATAGGGGQGRTVGTARAANGSRR